MTPLPQCDILAAALAFCDAGCSVIPVRADGTKQPSVAWKRYQQERASRAQVEQWFAGGHPGLGVVTGSISGNLELLELEGRAVHEGMLRELSEMAMASGLAELWRRVTVDGFTETSPGGGVHLLYRVLAPVAGNTKLARRPSLDGTEVLAETRGEGGYVVVAPSHGPVHVTGRPWQMVAGGPERIPDLTPDERDALHTLVRTLDRMPPPAPAPVELAGEFTQPSSGEGVSPGDDFNARASWDELLVPHGWTHVFSRGEERFWTRPGKKPSEGHSATTGYGAGDWLYVFSSSTVLPTEQTLTKFAALAHLEHGGDFRAAARALRAKGYGSPAPEHPRPAVALTAAASSPSEATEPSTYSLTDDGNARRLLDAHGHELRYVPQRGQWLAWNGARWRWDSLGVVHEHARALANALPVDSAEDRRHRAWSLSARGLAAMVKVAQTDPKVAVSAADLDNRAWELNTPAGVVDLRTGQLRGPDPDALHTRSTTVAPDFDAVPTRWLRFLADTFAGDEAMTIYLQRLLGVALVGQVLEQVLPFAFGEGANGKTTLLGTVLRLLGLSDAGYALTAPADILLASNQSRHTTELARLSGARLVVTSELEDGQRFAEAKVKMLTGGDPITARFMRQDDFTFRPTHSLWLLANHAPEVRAGGTAFWRRIKQIAFLHVVPPERRDPHLEDRLVEHDGPAILAWLLRGCADYVTSGLAEPENVRVATAAYQRDQDTVARFVDEACKVGDPAAPHLRIKVAELRAAYETWCRVEGETPVSAKALTVTLRRYGVRSDRDMSTRWYLGIRHVEAEEASSDSDAGTWWQR